MLGRSLQEQSIYGMWLKESSISDFETLIYNSRHQLNHSTEVYYKCEMCDRTFVRQDLLSRHTERQ